MANDIIVSRDDWSLHRKGYLDQTRHEKKVEDVIKQQMNDLIVNESIILSDGKNTTTIPIRSLEEFRFRYDPDKKNQTGQGIRKMVPGEIIGTENDKGQGGIGAGDEPGEDIYEAEVTYEDLATILFKELKLPNLEEKNRPIIAHDRPEFNDIRKKGCMANVDKKRRCSKVLRGRPLRRRSACPNSPLFINS